ncbi:GNAT family N-acetyltransferase [Streptomyces sp. NPDC060333]|uniref:GNAT family N-acetyltransferase n=1 Tax=Streptomyces sp. NPDC060333 TaxID=3347098 RepID=UPI0036470551
MSITITPLTEAHADETLAIYQAGIDEGNATFETTAPTWAQFDEAKLAEHRFAARSLLHALIASTEAAGIWTIQSGIFPENIASLAVHARAGFRVIGTRERIGRHHGVWRDVVLLERRSPDVD